MSKVTDQVAGHHHPFRHHYQLQKERRLQRHDYSHILPRLLRVAESNLRVRDNDKSTCKLILVSGKKFLNRVNL